MVEDYVENMETVDNAIEEILTNGRAFCAIIGTRAVLPNGRVIGADALDWDDCEATAAQLSQACRDAVRALLARDALAAQTPKAPKATAKRAKIALTTAEADALTRCRRLHLLPESREVLNSLVAKGWLKLDRVRKNRAGKWIGFAVRYL